MIEDIREDYEYTLGNPPYSHAELTNLTAFMARMKFDPEKGQAALKEAGIKFTMEENLKTIARNNKTKPAHIFEILKTAKVTKAPVAEETEKKTENGIDMSKYESLTGSGMGKKKSISKIAESIGISVDTALERLKKNTILKQLLRISSKMSAERQG